MKPAYRIVKGRQTLVELYCTLRIFWDTLHFFIQPHVKSTSRKSRRFAQFKNKFLKVKRNLEQITYYLSDFFSFFASWQTP